MASAHIQWYPGHMHKASREIKANRSKVHVFIELLDARVPWSSANPMLESLRCGKPVVRVLAKSDLADTKRSSLWESHFSTSEHNVSLFLDARKKGALSRVISECRKAVGQDRKRVTAMVVGIPNSGKSTLINSLAGRSVAKTGDEPAVTRQQQFVEITPGFVLLDTPGVMWPKIENPESGFRLSITGAIRDAVVPRVEVGFFAIRFLQENYPERIVERYRLPDCNASEEDVLEEIGRRRGCLVKGGAVDLERAAKILISDLREGRLGRITLETPAMIAVELERDDQNTDQ